jgi:hypothetical protein
LVTDDLLRGMAVSELYGFATNCDVEPADPTVCDACAAFIIAQEKENAVKDEIKARDYAGSEFVTGGQPTNAEYEKLGSSWRPEYPAPSWPLENQPQFSRPWLFEPGDKVLCLMPTATGQIIVSGVVQQIRIPGPIRTEKVVQVQLDEDVHAPLSLAWWPPDLLERIHG